MLTLKAARTAALFNLSELAAPFQISRPTIRDYVTLLERVFLLEQLPPWHSNRLKRLVKTPKLHLGDIGLACALLGIDAAGLAANRTLMGQLLETFVYQELRRQASWRADATSFFHFRDRDGAEVDIVIERGTQALAGVEVKAGATVTAADFRALRKLRDAAGGRFVGGVVNQVHSEFTLQIKEAEEQSRQGKTGLWRTCGETEKPPKPCSLFNDREMDSASKRAIFAQFSDVTEVNVDFVHAYYDQVQHEVIVTWDVRLDGEWGWRMNEVYRLVDCLRDRSEVYVDD